VDSNYEKADKLLEIRDNASSRLAVADAEIDNEKDLVEGEEIDTEDTWYRRLDAGLFTLQNVDYILAWISMEDDGIRAHLIQMLERKAKSLKDIVRTLQIYRDNVGAVERAASADALHNGLERAPSQKEILQHLIDFLDSCS